MTDTRLMSLALRVLGVQCAIGVIEYIGQGWMFGMTGSAMEGPRFGWILAGVMPIILLGGTAFALTRYADRLAMVLVPASSSVSLAGHLDERWWYRIAFSLLGVWLLVWTVPVNVTQLIVTFTVSLGPDTGMSVEAGRGAWNLLLRTAVQIIFGLYLILGSSHLYGLICRTRGDSTT